MRFDWTGGSIGIGSAILLICVGCGGDGQLPVGGPFGGTLAASVVVDGGILSDSSGVLDTGPPMMATISGVPTWTELYNVYFVVGTLGNCTNPKANCHASDMDNPADAFNYLASPLIAQVGGPNPQLVQPGKSYLSWFAGTMPADGPMSATAVKDFTAWAAAGAQNN